VTVVGIEMAEKVVATSVAILQSFTPIPNLRVSGDAEIGVKWD
jgi:hypothetical protein